MDRVRFGYVMEGTEAYPTKTFEGGEYITPHTEDFMGGLIEESGQTADELEGLNVFEKIAQAKKWRNTAKTVLTQLQLQYMIKSV